jgi:hypothetical protein
MSRSRIFNQSVRFYTTLFATDPVVRKPDHAKWMLADPHVNFAISKRGARTGVDHLGIEVDTADELRETYGRLDRTGQQVRDQDATACYYANSEKAWISNPQGIAWETFMTSGQSSELGYGADPGPCSVQTNAAACCSL